GLCPFPRRRLRRGRAPPEGADPPRAVPPRHRTAPPDAGLRRSQLGLRMSRFFPMESMSSLLHSAALRSEARPPFDTSGRTGAAAPYNPSVPSAGDASASPRAVRPATLHPVRPATLHSVRPEVSKDGRRRAAWRTRGLLAPLVLAIQLALAAAASVKDTPAT